MKVTQKEKTRANKTKEQLTRLHNEGYKVAETTISAMTANIMAIVFGAVLLIPVVLAYYLKFGYVFGGPEESLWELGLICFLMFAMIVVHELIHGLFMYLFNGHDKSLVEFGIMSGCPYCTCQAPINKTKYIVILLMPSIILGIIFIALAFTFGKFWWLFSVVAVIVGGGGDFTITWKLLMTKTKNAKIIDHPYKCGFFLLSENLEQDMYENVSAEIDNLKVSEK